MQIFLSTGVDRKSKSLLIIQKTLDVSDTLTAAAGCFSTTWENGGLGGVVLKNTMLSVPKEPF